MKNGTIKGNMRQTKSHFGLQRLGFTFGEEKRENKRKKKEKEKKTKNQVCFCLGIMGLLMSRVLVWISMENSWSFV